MVNTNRTRVFVSYSHKDKQWLQKFVDMLAPDIRNGRVDYWDDQDIQPGDPWHAKILAAIDSARVAILLVSPDFLASRFVMEEELPRILDARTDGLTIIWIPLSGKFYGSDAPPQMRQLSEVQAAFDAATPLDDREPASQTAILIDLCRNIQRVLNPGRIPWNLPFSSLAKLFKGREDALAQLDLSIRQHGSAAVIQPQAVHGLGGIGKTRLAIEYAWQHQEDFTAFLFVSANRLEDLDRNLAALCRPGDCLDLPEFKSSNQDDQRDAVIRWLQQNKGWLLILDNVDTDEGVRAVKSIVAKLRGGHVLITSRVTEWGRGVRTLALDVLPLDDAVGLLLDSTRVWRKARPDDGAQARILAERLGNLPLALTHAAAYMQHHHQGFVAYLEDFERNFERLLAYHDHIAIEYETELEQEREESATAEARTARKHLLKTVATTFFLSFDRLSTLSKAILQGVSFLAPAPIPTAMFQQTPTETSALLDLWCRQSGESRPNQPLADAIADLARYSLLTRSDETLSVHRMEQRILRSRVLPASMPRWHECICAVLCKYVPDETAESPRTWLIWDVLRPHAEFLIAAFVSDDRIPAHHDLMSAVGSLLFGKGLYALSLKLEEDGLKVARRTTGEESREMANRLLAYGESLRVLERSAEALKAFQKSIAIREKLDGPESLRVAVALNYQGMTHSDLHQEKESKTCYRRAVAIYDQHPGEVDDDDLAKVLSNLASLIWTEKVEEAENLLSRAVGLTDEQEGGQKIKPQLSVVCNTKLALLLSSKGEFESAERFFQKAIKLVCLFPPEHPYREQVMESYAAFLRRAHRLSEAKSQFASARTGPRPKWGSADLENEPERRIRGKLRVVEATASFAPDTALQSEVSALLPAICADLSDSPSAPWNPLMIKGLTLRDTENLSFDFLIDSGTESASDAAPSEITQELMSFFLTAMAVDEADQWVASDGSMPQEMRSTQLATQLLAQARTLAAFVSCAIRPDCPIGAAFVAEVDANRHQSPTVYRDLRIEVWLTPSNAQVYVGDPVGEWAKFGAKGVAHCFVTRAEFEVHWQWHFDPVGSYSGENARAILSALDAAFESRVAPVVRRAVAESRLFAPLRQINYCLVLGLWFKQTYHYHPSIAKFLETGDPNQLSPTIRKMSMLTKDKESGVKEIDVSTTEAVWQRAIELNNKALDLRKLGRFSDAEPLLLAALDLDESLRGPNDPKIAHRLNNLVTVLLLQGKYGEARPQLARAWSIKQLTGHDITTPRVLFVRFTLALLAAQPTELFIGQLKTALSGSEIVDNANVAAIWDIAYFIEHLRSSLSADSAALLEALATAVNDRAELSSLNRFESWRTSPGLSLETPWPPDDLPHPLEHLMGNPQ